MVPAPRTAALVIEYDSEPGYDYTLRVKELAGDKEKADPDNKHYQLLEVEKKTSVQAPS